jgi:hypothetical protein
MNAKILLCVALIEVGSAAMVPAQPVTRQAAAFAPVQCFAYATDAESLTNADAVRLCTGAISDAPARCYQAASDSVDFLGVELVRMCAMATSTAPAQCAERLDDTTALTNGAIARYCAAQQWPVVPAQNAGSPACVEEATDETSLTDQQAFQLCRGSTSSAPLACYRAGTANLSLSDFELVRLCAAVVPYPPALR